jgi:hypothetical protein
MTKQELRDAIYDEFVNRYYQSELCDLNDSGFNMYANGNDSIESKAFELLEELADATMTVMHNNSVLKASKHECEI